MIANALPFVLERPLVFIDSETTGTDTQKDRIVELSLVIFRPRGEEPETRTRRLNPECSIPAEATAVHGITNDDVADCPYFRNIADGLLDLLDGCDLAGTNIRRFDLPILVAEFERTGRRFDLDGVRILDTQNVFHKEEPRTLEAAVRLYLGREHDGAHGAEADAIASADVLFAQIERYGLPTNLDELHDYCDEVWRYETEADRWWDRSDEDPKRWVFKRGKHKGTELGKVPRDYLHWISGKADDMHPEVVQIAQNMLFGKY